MISSMDLILKKRLSDDIDFGLIYGAIALLALAAARYLPLQDILPSCLFKELIGVPCPTCGATRSLVNLAQGNLARSFSLNPAVPLTMMVVSLLSLSSMMTLISGRAITLSFTPREELLCRAGVVIAFLANWAYLALSL